MTPGKIVRFNKSQKQQQGLTYLLTYLQCHELTRVGQLTVEQVAADVRTVDVAGDVERGRKQSQEPGDQHQWKDLDGLAATGQHVVPQLTSVRHLQPTPEFSVISR